MSREVVPYFVPLLLLRLVTAIRQLFIEGEQLLMTSVAERRHCALYANWSRNIVLSINDACGTGKQLATTTLPPLQVLSTIKNN